MLISSNSVISIINDTDYTVTAADDDWQRPEREQSPSLRRTRIQQAIKK